MRKFISRNWFWIALGCGFQKEAIDFAYIERGYTAFGGEWLVLPTILLAVEMVRDIIGVISEMREEEENFGECNSSSERDVSEREC